MPQMPRRFNLSRHVRRHRVMFTIDTTICGFSLQWLLDGHEADVTERALANAKIEGAVSSARDA